MKMGCQVENRRSCNHQFYIAMFRPSLEEIKKDEASKKYHMLSTTAQRINKKIEQLKADEEEITWKLEPIYRLESRIYWKIESIEGFEYSIACYEKKLPKNSVPRKTGVIYLTETDAKKPIRPDQKRCQKRLINKGRMDIEYLQQVEEELLSSKKNGGMTSCGTQELNDLINSMTQRIQHGCKNRKEEMEIHDKLRELKITREMYTVQEPKPSDYWHSEDYLKREEENQRRWIQEWKQSIQMGCQVENRRSCIHQFYIAKFRPSLEEIKKDEAYKKYHMLITTAQRISKEIEQLKADEKEIKRKLEPIYYLERRVKWQSESIESLEHSIANYEKKPTKNSVPRNTGVINLTKIDAKKPIRPDQKRCQKRLINKGRMDMEYLQQVEEELLSSKKIGGMTSCGTQELNDLMNSMAQRIQHGCKNRKEEMEIHDKLRELKITREMYTVPEPKPSYYWHSEDYLKKQEEYQRGWVQGYKQQLKVKLFDLGIMKKDQMRYKTKVMRFEAKLQHVEKDIFYLQEELEYVHSEREMTYDLIQMLRKQETCYDEYQSLLINVKEVAQTGDVAKVKQLCDTQVEGFMAQWNNNQAFRDDYQRRKLIDA